MDNYLIDDNFRGGIEWMLFIPKGEKLTFQFSVFTSENRKDPEDSNVDFSNKLLGILQDIFYVTKNAIIRYDKESGSPKRRS